MRVALAQINATVGDIDGNEAKVRERLARAREAGAQLVLFPELAVTGYPPEDLLLKEHFLADARAAVERIAADAQGIVALVGFPERADDVYNAAAVLADGERAGHLPQGQPAQLRRLRRAALLPARRRRRRSSRSTASRSGLTICEDIWVPGPPMTDEALAGARLIAQHLRLALPGRQGPPSASR